MSPALSRPSPANAPRPCARSRSRSTETAASTPTACLYATCARSRPPPTLRRWPPAGRRWSAAAATSPRPPSPNRGPSPPHGRILAFNAIVEGHRAILAHVYGTDPVPTSRIVVFHIRKAHGAYGTLLTGALPVSVNRYGYVKRISLSLHRNFTYRGRQRSYLSAACAAPPGFPGAVFPFARASMSFADGRTLASTLTRSCKVTG